jgi:2-polyprenyl-6-hydroxyphenyl methylase/3-demethylubiquinone-9 3-methyltransferase
MPAAPTAQASSEERILAEIRGGERFAFGKNWRKFLSVLDDDRIAEAERSLRAMLEVERLDGLRFLDIGSGSGLFSLAARRLGAKVRSFDYDPDAVECTRELKRRFFPDDPHWVIGQGSVLDRSYVTALGQFDVVYAWGVLHHTGKLWEALETAGQAVLPGGRLFLSVYNDQGIRSARWRRVKRLYCSGRMQRLLVLAIFIPYFVLGGLLMDLRIRQNPLTRYVEYRRRRGMSRCHDWFDWLGGYPFEVARPEEVFTFYRKRGFVLCRLSTCGGGSGCNEFVFQAGNASSSGANATGLQSTRVPSPSNR